MALRVGIEGLRFRASDRSPKAADQLRILQQRLSNPAGMPMGRAGDNLADKERYFAMRQQVAIGLSEVGGISALAATRASEITVPEVVLVNAGTFPVKGSKLFGIKPPPEYVNFMIYIYEKDFPGIKFPGKNKIAAANIAMSGFYAAKYPVMVGEYREFTEDTGYLITIKGQEGAVGLRELFADRTEDRHPVRFVNKADRNAYVAWLSEKTGEQWYILTAAQQEYIRRGNSGRAYPWGKDWREPPCFNQNKTIPVDAWPQGTTPEGISGIGIVWEATSSYFGNPFGAAYDYDPKNMNEKPYDYDPNIVKDPKGPETGESMECRGGSAWNDYRREFRGAYRGVYNPDIRGEATGFRLGKKLLSPESASSKK